MNRALATILGDRPIAYHPVLARIFDSTTAAIFLSQLLYWSDKGSDKDGWIYKTAEEWKDEIALSRSEMDTARRVLRDSGVMEEKLKGIPARLHYKVSFTILEQLINGFVPVGKREARKQVCRIPANLSAGFPQTISENTTEITTDISPEMSTSQEAVPSLPEQEHIVGSGEMTDAECAEYVEALPSGAEAMARDGDTPGMIEYKKQFGRKRWSTEAQRNLWQSTEDTVGSEVMLAAVMWGAETGISRVTSICTRAKNMAREREPPPIGGGVLPGSGPVVTVVDPGGAIRVGRQDRR